MPQKTPVQFAAPRDTEVAAPPAPPRQCVACGSRFSADARFCPFDGEPLGVASDLPRAPDPLIGSVVDDRYEVVSVLGEGGMGTVYRVRHRVLEKQLALKALRADLAREQDLGLRFLREAKAAASISHANVVQITDFGTLPSGQPYFVMELLAGESLSQLIRRGGPLPAARAVRLLSQMVEALAAAHAAGVVHRDLKPDNILVCRTPSGESVKVLDFGLAKVAGQSRLTKAGVVFGTPYYMSPEQASGGVVDERTDVYALGVVMYEMFTGRVPFEADTFMGVLTKHLYVEPTPPSVVLGGVSALGALEQITLRCLEKKAEKRFASMRALATELARVTKWSEDGTLTVEPPELREPRPAHRLADELELPSAVEMRLALKRAGLADDRVRAWTWAAAAFGLSLMVLTLGLWARGMLGRPGRVAPGEARPNVPGEAARSSAVVPVQERVPSPPATGDRPAAAAEPPPMEALAPSAGPVPSARHAARAPHTRSVQGARSSAPGAPPAIPQSGSKSSTAKDKVLGTEIVDPWSR